MASGTIRNQVCAELTSFQSGWASNGQSFYAQIGGFVYCHISIRGGTATDGTIILAFPSRPPKSTVLAPIFDVSNKTLNGYVLVDANGNFKIYGVANTTYFIADVSYLA